jgi:hypothetical protein
MLLFITLISLFCGPVLAAEAPPEVGPRLESPDIPAVEGELQPPSDEELHELEARSLYRMGLQLIDYEQLPEAEAVLRRVVDDYGDTEVSAQAAEMLAILETMEPGGLDPAALARAELAIDQAIAGAAFFGFLVPASTWQPSQPLGPVAMGLGGLGAGIGGGLVLGRKLQPSTGQVMSLFTGEVLGAANGAVLSSIDPPRDYRGVYRYTTAGVLLGAGSGVAAGIFLDPTPGQVSMVNAGALYGTCLSAWSFVFFPGDGNLSNKAISLRLLAGTDLGALAGGLLAWRFPVSRARMNVIHLSALTGTAVAGGSVLLIDWYGRNGMDEVPMAAMVVSGTALGAGVGALLTMNMSPSARFASASGVLLERRDGRWAMGVPMAMVAPDAQGGVAVNVPLAAGRF